MVRPGPAVRLLRRALTASWVAVALVCLWPTLLGPSAAQEDDTNLPSDELTVVMTELEPFVIDDDGEADGFYAEVWSEVAGELRVDYDIIWVDSFGELLEAVADGRADVAVAPLAPTAEREAEFDFTSAVITSGPQLGYSERLASRTTLFRALVDTRVLQVLLYAMLGVVLIGHVIWLVERNEDEDGPDDHFQSGYLAGVWDGIWWTMVTATTVGYGDRTPKSPVGRGIALVVMLLSLVLVGAFVSQITTVLTESSATAPFTDLDDLDGRPVGVVEGTSFEAFLQGAGVDTVGFDSQVAVFEAAASEQIDAVVANPFAMSEVGADYGVVGVGDVVYQEFETFGLAQDSPWREPINMVLADLQASGEVEEIVNRHLATN